MRSLLALAGTICCAIAIANDGVGLLNDNRVVVYTDYDQSPPVVIEAFPPAPFAHFDVLGQDTTVTAVSFHGAGRSYRTWDTVFAAQMSVFDVTFEVRLPTEMAMAGDMRAWNGMGFALVHVRLYLGDAIDDANLIYGESLTAVNEYTPGITNFAFQTVLESGVYRLVFDSDIFLGDLGPNTDWNFEAGFVSIPLADTDDDGLVDIQDNCIEHANPAQTDADGDGIGNACDADLNNDCVVNAQDLGAIRLAFFSTDPAADFNVDGVVNVVDVGMMMAAFYAAPGPSGIGNLCD